MEAEFGEELEAEFEVRAEPNRNLTATGVRCVLTRHSSSIDPRLAEATSDRTPSVGLDHSTKLGQYRRILDWEGVNAGPWNLD